MTRHALKFFEGLRGDIMVLLYGPKKLNCMSHITRKIDTTYAYGTLILSEFEKGNYTKSKLVGRRREVTLTEKGIMAAEAIIEFRAKLKEAENI